MLRSPLAFRRFAWATLVVTVFVILWGGFVRASGSGAGCGDHWPLCNGEVIPRAASVETVIEMTHRLTSGVVMLMALLVLIWARRAYPADAHPRGTSGAAVRRYAGWGFFFMTTEALVGAGLVLLEYVAYNVSVARGYWMAAHLANTFLLLGAQTLTLYAAHGGHRPRIRSPLGWGLVGILAATMLLGMSGAVAALGDTLTLSGGIDPADDPIVATLVGLRIVHPLLACAVLLGVIAAVWRTNTTTSDPVTRWFGGAVVALFLVQMGVGLTNVALMAPVWMQIVHLFVTDVIWVTMIFFVARTLDPTVAPRAVTAPTADAEPRVLEAA